MCASHQWYYDFAIGVGFEVVWGLEALSDEPMVVNFAIDRKGNALVAVGERLSSRVDANNRQPFVGKHYEGSEIAPPRCKRVCAYLCCWLCSFQTNLGHDACTASPSSRP